MNKNKELTVRFFKKEINRLIRISINLITEYLFVDKEKGI